jgi:uncharacterized protein (DUF697 family)
MLHIPSSKLKWMPKMSKVYIIELTEEQHEGVCNLLAQSFRGVTGANLSAVNDNVIKMLEVSRAFTNAKTKEEQA